MWKSNILVFAKRPIYYVLFIMLCVILYFLITSGMFFYYNTDYPRLDIAKITSSDISDIIFERVDFSFGNGAKGIVVVYRVMNNKYHSSAYWIPFGQDPIMVWK